MTRWDLPVMSSQYGSSSGSESRSYRNPASTINRRVLGPGRPVIQPSGCAPVSVLEELDGTPDMLAFDVLGHIDVIDPTIAVADDFVATLDKGPCQHGILLERAGN